MKTTKRPYTIHRSWAAFFFCAIALICSGCFSPWKGAGDEGRFTINLGDGNSRAAVAWPGDDPSAVSQLNFTATFLSGGSAAATFSSKGKDRITGTITPGTYYVELTITVLADGTFYGTGTPTVNPVTIVPGQNTITIKAIQAGDGTQTEFTVTFDSNGGSGTAPLPIGANAGSSITIPGGTGMIYSGYHFTGWNTKADGTGTAYAPNDSYTPGEDITLYAWYNAPKVGDTGPGGGIIFYHDPAGFTMADDGTTAYYLEAASTNMSPGGTWGISWSYPSAMVSGTSIEIGAGRKNTSLILATNGTAPAAAMCDTYSTTVGSDVFDDWFLPSKDEHNELYKYWQQNDVPGWGSNNEYGVVMYWTSSQGSNSSRAWAQHITDGNQEEWDQSEAECVRAIRAF
jgi:hypothetical protein